MRAALVGLLAAFGAAMAGAQTKVEVPSLERHEGAPLALAGHWFAAPATGARPAIVLLHGCGGAYDRQGRLGERMRAYAALLNGEGWHALVLDSLGPRGVKELCTQTNAERAVNQVHRRQDALGALQWLAARADVDASRVALLGWSNGGSTVLAASNRRHPLVARQAVTPRAAVAFYPGCEAERRRGYAGTAPLLLLVGEADDWTPPQPCRDLAAQAQGPVSLVAYADAHHGFDGNAPVRQRGDVPGGANPGQGVTVGGNPAAREASQRELLAFLREQLR